MRMKTILIVDDEPMTRKGLQKTLEVWGAGRYDILVAEDGDEALDMLGQKQVHVLITDIRMPEMSGLQLVKTMRGERYQPVVIVLSGYSEFDYAREALQLGVVNYLLKPVAKQKLIEAVEQALEIEERRQRAEMIEKVVDLRLVDLQAKDRHAPPPIQAAIRYIEDNLRRQIGLREVAEHVHLNQSYFSALFKEKTDLTFSEYVTRSRMQYAKHLLVFTDMPVAAVAEEVGYQTVKYFITLFKEYEGMTPSQYRRQIDGNEPI